MLPTTTSLDNFLIREGYRNQRDFSNNPGLCGAPIFDPCPAPAKKSHLGVMAGGIAGGLTFVIVLTGVALLYISRMKVVRKRREDPEGNRWAKSMKGTKAVKASTLLFVYQVFLFHFGMAHWYSEISLSACQG